MSHPDELRPILRAAAVDNDVVQVALALRAHARRGQVTRLARLVRAEFGLTIAEAIALAAWAEGPGDDEQSRAELRAMIRTPLRDTSVPDRRPGDG